MNNITKISKCQYSDISDELNAKFQPKKEHSEYLAFVYQMLGYKKRFANVLKCGSYLEFAVTPNLDWKLHTANFCRDRLCPMCSWRRSMKIYGQCSRVMNELAKDYTFLFLTLTVPNIPGSALSSKLDEMQEAWHDRFIKIPAFKNVVKGFWRGVEVTRNRKNNTYHPHYHVVLVVNKSYFDSKSYITRDTWLKMWQNAMNDSSITQVDIRKANAQAVPEVCKYAVKDAHYLFDDVAETMEVVNVLFNSLYGRRLVSLGGEFKRVHALLNLDDMEDGDLVHLDPVDNPDLITALYRYNWAGTGYVLKDILGVKTA